jgi:hypothetical protein
MTPRARRVVLVLHLTTSIGWVGAVLAFLAIAALGLTSDDERTVRSVYIVMAPAAWLVLVPLAFGSLLSGVAISLGTPWGLFRHYWVVLKLGITAFSTLMLVIYMSTFRDMAQIATDMTVRVESVRNPSPVLHAVVALILLVTATVLGIFKPFGMTLYGRRRAGSITAVDNSDGSNWLYVGGVIALAAAVLFIVLHLLAGNITHG